MSKTKLMGYRSCQTLKSKRTPSISGPRCAKVTTSITIRNVTGRQKKTYKVGLVETRLMPIRILQSNITNPYQSTHISAVLTTETAGSPPNFKEKEAMAAKTRQSNKQRKINMKRKAVKPLVYVQIAME